MEFLCEHNFDFNKWIYEGIPYCTAKEVWLRLLSVTLGHKNLITLKVTFVGTACV